MNRGLIVGGGILAVAVAIGVVALRPDEESPRVVEPAASPLVAATDPGLTPQISEGFGAAALLPDDVSSYSASMDLSGRWTRIWQSNAVQNLVSLPTLQQAWMQADQNPDFQNFLQSIFTHPLAVQGLPVLKDAVSNEIFVCAGPDFPEMLSAAGELYGEMSLARMQLQLATLSGGPPAELDAVVEDLIATLLENEDRLKLPSILAGCRLSNVASAKQFLDTWLPQINASPVGVIEPRTIKDGQFYVLEMSGQQLPDHVIGQMSDALQSAEMSQDKIDQLIGFVRGQQATIAIGILDDYLILSLGSDTSLLERWKSENSLAASEHFSLARAHFKDGLISLNYAAESMAAEPLTSEDVENLAEYLLDLIPEATVPAPLGDRIRKDIKLLAAEIPTTEPYETLSFSFENKGIETISFGEPFPSTLDGSQALSLLTHRGQKPIVASAARAAKNPESYAQAVKWLKIGAGYFEDFALPAMPPEGRTEYDKAMVIALPFLQAIDKATRDHLIPATDGTQSLFVIDGDGQISVLPDGEELNPPFVIPRLGAAVELNDAQQFKLAIESYAVASRQLIKDAYATYPETLPPGIEIPHPQTSEVAGGTLYYYPLPVNLGADVFPSALLKDRLLLLASSSALAEQMAAEQPMPHCSVTGIDAAAGSVSVIEFSAFWDFMKALGDSSFTLLQQRGRNDHMAPLIKMHIDTTLRSLRAFRSYRSTTTLHNGRALNHSWLHVEDISR